VSPGMARQGKERDQKLYELIGGINNRGPLSQHPRSSQQQKKKKKKKGLHQLAFPVSTRATRDEGTGELES